MSAPESPDDERLSSSQRSIHPALRPSVTSVPVTPGGAGESTYVHPEKVSEEPEAISPEDRRQGDSTCNQKSYFALKEGEERAASPTEMAAGARSGEDLLRRLSLSGQLGLGGQADIDPRTAHPSLSLSGGIISATICLPYDIGHVPGGHWVRSNREER